MLGDRIKRLRKRNQRTQKEAAESIGVSRSSYSHIENNRNEPDCETLKRIAVYYGVTTDYLLGHNILKWETNKDLMDLEELLSSDVNMTYAGKWLTEAEKQRAKDLLTGVFWDKLKM